MRSIIGQCPECCECPDPVVLVKSRSASKTKCGFPENTGFESTPPKLYALRTITSLGEWRLASASPPLFDYWTANPSAPLDLYMWTGACPGGITEVFRNYISAIGPSTSIIDELEYSKTSCSLTGSALLDPDPTYSAVTYSSESLPCPSGDPVIYGDVDFPAGGFTTPNSANDYFTTTSTFSGYDWTKLNTGDSFSKGGSLITGTPSNLGCDWGGTCDGPTTHTRVYFAAKQETVLSDEYTTAELKTNTLADLAAASFTPYAIGAPSSSFSVTTDETSASAVEDVYKIIHRIPKIGRGICYHISEWIERFTPVSGAVVDTPRSYVWDGIKPVGYNPADQSTWPQSTEFNLTPTDPGEITVGHYTTPGDPETFVEGFPPARCRGCPT